MTTTLKRHFSAAILLATGCGQLMQQKPVLTEAQAYHATGYTLTCYKSRDAAEPSVIKEGLTTPFTLTAGQSGVTLTIGDDGTPLEIPTVRCNVSPPAFDARTDVSCTDKDEIDSGFHARSVLSLETGRGGKYSYRDAESGLYTRVTAAPGTSCTLTEAKP
jgi:hypothetical protein